MKPIHYILILCAAFLILLVCFGYNKKVNTPATREPNPVPTYEATESEAIPPNDYPGKG